MPDTIKALRAQLGVTQAQMAIHMHVSLNTYKRWEWGLRKPNIKHAEKMRWMARKYGGWKRGTQHKAIESSSLYPDGDGQLPS